MAIGKIEPIKSITPSHSVPGVTSASKTLQNQIQMKQQTLKKLSNDSSLSVSEKEKERQTLEKEIEVLKRKLEQIQLKQEESQKTEETEKKQEVDLEKVAEAQTEKDENNTSAIQKSEEHKKETVKISAEDAQKMLDTNLFLKEEMVQQGADYDKENNVRILTAEIKLDEMHGKDTSSKEEQLKELREKENFWKNTKYNEDPQAVYPLLAPDMQVIIR